MSEWKRYKLGELLRVKHGWAFKGEFFSETGIQSILTPGNFYESGGFKANTSKDRFYIGEYPKEYLCSKGDLIVAMTEQAAGLLGSTAIVPEDNRYLHNQRIGLISCNECLNKDFAYYLFMTQTVRQQISRSASGTKVKHTSPEKIYEVQVYIPKIQTQRNIAKILTTLDQKIQINNQINQELEAMAKALYDYWFVQFDFPDQNGKPYKSSGGKMVYNPELKREIPEGWGVEKLGELAQFKNGINYEKTSSGSEKVKIINVRNISSSTIFINQTDLDEIFLENDKSTNFIVNEGMILITRSGIPGATRLVSELEAKTVYSGFIIASEVNDLIYKNLIFYYLKNVEEVLKNQSAGTIMKNISQSVLTDMVVSLPPKNLLLKFNSIIDNLLEQMKNVQRQNQELIQLRDWLLPMLMNGQVKVI